MKGNSHVEKPVNYKVVSGGTTVSNPVDVKQHPTAGSKKGVSAKGNK